MKQEEKEHLKLLSRAKRSNTLKPLLKHELQDKMEQLFWLSARKKFKGGGEAKDNRPLFLENNRLLFLLFFLLFLKILGGKSRFGGHPLPPSVAESQIVN